MVEVETQWVEIKLKTQNQSFPTSLLGPILKCEREKAVIIACSTYANIRLGFRVRVRDRLELGIG